MVQRVFYFLFILYNCCSCIENNESKINHAAQTQLTVNEKANIIAYPAQSINILNASGLIKKQFQQNCESVLSRLDQLDMHLVTPDSARTKGREFNLYLKKVEDSLHKLSLEYFQQISQNNSTNTKYYAVHYKSKDSTICVYLNQQLERISLSLETKMISKFHAFEKEKQAMKIR